jgi:hypothetical protein
MYVYSITSYYFYLDGWKKIALKMCFKEVGNIPRYLIKANAKYLSGTYL